MTLPDDSIVRTVLPEPGRCLAGSDGNGSPLRRARLTSDALVSVREIARPAGHGLSLPLPCPESSGSLGASPAAAGTRDGAGARPRARAGRAAAPATAAPTTAAAPASGLARCRTHRAGAADLSIEHRELAGEILVDRLELRELIVAQLELGRIVDQIADRRARRRRQRRMLVRLDDRLGFTAATGEARREREHRSDYRGPHVTWPTPGPSHGLRRAGCGT
jgi:hypothetical protein